jgi:DNA-binding response OmpR family regulator
MAIRVRAMTDSVSQPIHVLVVDDEPLFVTELCDTLARRGFRAFGAGSAADAEIMVRREPGLDVALVDLRMPGRGGVGFIGWLVEYRRGPGCPRIIVITGHAATLDSLGAVADFADGLLTKPLDLGALISATNNAARRRRSSINHTIA